MQEEAARIEALSTGTKTAKQAPKARLTGGVFALLGAAILAVGGYLYQQPDGVSTGAPRSSDGTSKRPDIRQLQGISPAELLKNSDWGPRLAAAVPPLTQQCLTATVSELPLLQLNGSQGAISSAHGSHAENWVTGYFYAGFEGQFEVALLCNDTSDHLLLLTSRGVGASPTASLVQWLKDQGSNTSAVTVLDGKQQRETTVGELLGAPAQSASRIALPAGTRVHVRGDAFQTQGGALAVVDADVGKQLMLNQQAVAKVAGDLIEIVDAYRFKGHDLAIVTYACGGSGCTYTSFAVLDIQANGQAQVFTDEQLTIDADGTAPEVALQPDGSLLISFHGFKGQQRWRYADGHFAKT